jgi:protein-disulfide isomerase
MIPKSGHRFSDKIMRKGKPFGTSFKPTECQLQITRREFCQKTTTVALSLAVLGASSLPPFPGVAALAETVPTDELMKPDALPDLALGDAKAPVTIIEYASLGCSHCAHFDETTFPELKKRYIDTGKVRYILRDFPLDEVAAVAFVFAHCAGNGDNDKYYSIVDTLFRQQPRWYQKNPVPPLTAIAKQAGFTEASFNACVANQKAWDAMESVRQRAINQFKVQSTPTFFVNGERVVGAVSIEEMAKVIDPYLKGG